MSYSGPIPESWQRQIAVIAMVWIAGLAALLWYLMSFVSGLAENLDPLDRVRADNLAVVSAVGTVGALVCIVGLARRVRPAGLMGAIAVAGCALIVLLATFGDIPGTGNGSFVLKAALVWAILTGLLALWASLLPEASPRDSGRRPVH